MREKPRYLSFLLRLWQVRDGDQVSWRAAMEWPGSGEQRGFANLEDLFAFMRHLTREDGEEQRPGRDPDQAPGL